MSRTERRWRALGFPLFLVLLEGCAATAGQPSVLVSQPVSVTQSPTAQSTQTAPAATTAPRSTSSPSTTSRSTTSKKPALPDPCELLTQEEASTLAGLDLAEGVKAGPDPADTMCQYTADPNGPVGQVEIYFGDGAKKSFDIDKDVLDHDFTSVPGIGDEAQQEDGNIFFRKGNTWAQIRLVLLNDPAENVEPLQTAAKIVVSRMP